MAGKLKNLDLKGFGIRHGEKIVFGLVASFALYMLSGADWISFDHHPVEVTNEVRKAEDALKERTWPEEEQAQFVVEEEETVENLVRNMRTHVDPSPYSFSQNFEFDIYGTTSPITEPDFLPVRRLIADAGRVVMYVVEEVQQPSTLLAEEIMDSQEEEEEPEDQSDIPDEFKSRDNSSPGRGTFGRGTPGRGALGRGGSRKGRDDFDFTGNFDPSRIRFSLGNDEDDEDGYAIGGGRGYSRSGTAGRGERFVSVRGVVPLHEQLQKIKKASNVSRSTAEALYEIIDFELQRKRMQPHADDPWSGDWEPVDVDFSKQVLLDAANFDPPVVEGIVTDSAITMPLPQRVMGVWGKIATHPDLENFTLTEEEIDLEIKIYERLLKKHQEQMADAPESPIMKRGFNDLLGGNSRRLAGTVGRGNDEDDEDGSERNARRGGKGRNDDYRGFNLGGRGGAFGGYGGAPSVSQADFLAEFEDIEKPEVRDKLMEYVKERITASGQLLLFRHLDFDVEPGATYKYRVRLEVMNPNYGRKSSEAAGVAEVVEGQTRKTEWSNVTEAAYVPRDAEYFVTDIDEPRGSSLSTANFALFKWDPDYGTTVEHGHLGVELGEEIGGREQTHVLDPARERFEIEDYQFQTGDILVDAFQNDSIRTTQHDDLKLATGRDLGLSNQVLVLQSDGELVVIDEVTRKQELEQRERYLEFEQAEYEDIKDLEISGNETARSGGRGGIFADYDDEDFEDGGKGKDRRNRGRTNPLRRSSNKKGKYAP